MTIVRSAADLGPALLLEPEAAWPAIRVATQAEAMGLLRQGVPRERMADLIGEAFEALARAGIARREVVSLESARPAELAGIVARVAAALAASPNPDTEWSAVAGRLGDELLTRLCHVSPSSLARYASGTRPTPDPVAARLHHVALVVADLAGSYNDRGVRRWFDRPRPQLEDAPPSALLTGDWDPDDDGPQQVAGLAATLAGAGTAA